MFGQRSFQVQGQQDLLAPRAAHQNNRVHHWPSAGQSACDKPFMNK
jgi:hypothetical protein